MKKLLSYFLLIGFLFVQIPPVIAKESLPELPALPDFDTVLAPDNVDVFAPSAQSPQIAPKTPAVQQKPAAQVTKTSTTPKTSTMKEVKSSTVQKPVVTTKNNQPTYSPVQKTTYSNNKTTAKNSYAVPKGKKFKVRLQQTVSDTTPEGTRISFVSLYPETSTYVTVPAGTVFKGRVSNSHTPGLTGNGGLIVINVDQMVYRGRTYDINAKVSIANDKQIYFNNIKGKRMYFQSFPKAMQPGTKFFKKMWRVTCKLAQNESGVEIILTPFSLLTGTVVYAVNLITSPVLAIFYKGKSITIPSGSPFTIQLREDAVLSK